MININQNLNLITTNKPIINLLNIQQKNSNINLNIKHQNQTNNPNQIKYNTNLNHPQTPHTQPTTQHTNHNNTIYKTIHLHQHTHITLIKPTLNQFNTKINHTQINPNTHHTKQPIKKTNYTNTFKFKFNPINNNIITFNLHKTIPTNKLQ